MMDNLELNNDIQNLELDVEQYSEPVEFWENKQRELVVSVVDYNLMTLADLIEKQNIDLSPNYQRRIRWDDKRKSLLIESFLLNVPVPPIFLNEDDYGRYSVIDGKQRLTAIREFLRGALRLSGLQVFADLNGKRIDDLPPRLQSVLRTRSNLRATIILHQSDKDVKYEVFRRLNTGGMSLNAQEIRNSVFPGPFNQMLMELSALPLFQRLLGITEQDRLLNKSKLYREMGDVEYVLRYFTLRDNWRNLSTTPVRAMDRYIEENQHQTREKITQNRNDFVSTLSLVDIVFGSNSFERWNPETEKWRAQPLRAIYDVQMQALQGRSKEFIIAYKAQIFEGFKQLFKDKEFSNAVDGGQPAEILKRIQMFSSLLDTLEK